jgi:hypothetical protein
MVFVYDFHVVPAPMFFTDGQIAILCSGGNLLLRAERSRQSTVDSISGRFSSPVRRVSVSDVRN